MPLLKISDLWLILYINLVRIKEYLGCGNYYPKSNTDVGDFIVGRFDDNLNKIIAHFDKYQLITQKWSDFDLFKSGVELISDGEHLTIEGLKKIISIKASMNKGLPDGLKEAFPDIIPVARPLVKNQSIPDPQWVAGFMSGEGSLIIRVKKSSTNRTGLQVELVFQITQHTRDEQLLLSFIKYFGCGRYRQRKGGLEILL